MEQSSALLQFLIEEFNIVLEIYKYILNSSKYKQSLHHLILQKKGRGTSKKRNKRSSHMQGNMEIGMEEGQ